MRTHTLNGTSNRWGPGGVDKKKNIYFKTNKMFYNEAITFVLLKLERPIERIIIIIIIIIN